MRSLYHWTGTNKKNTSTKTKSKKKTITTVKN